MGRVKVLRRDGCYAGELVEKGRRYWRVQWQDSAGRTYCTPAVLCSGAADAPYVPEHVVVCVPVTE